MKTYEVNIKYYYETTRYVKANSEKEAEEMMNDWMDGDNWKDLYTEMYENNPFGDIDYKIRVVSPDKGIKDNDIYQDIT